LSEVKVLATGVGANAAAEPMRRAQITDFMVMMRYVGWSEMEIMRDTVSC
jgi:hypothetical protein